MKRYILAIDEGTTSERVILFDTLKRRILDSHSLPLSCSYPHSGWVEQDANQIWESVKASALFLIKNHRLTAQNTFGFAITNQREAVCSWDTDGNPIAPVISWQCKRTSDECEQLSQDKKDFLKAKTGLILDSYFSASKMKWLIDNNKSIKQNLENGQLHLGTIDSFLIYKLTDGKVFATDTTNACRTMLVDITHPFNYDTELLKFWGINQDVLPKICNCIDDYGKECITGENLPILAVIGDQQSSLVGQGCTSKNVAKMTFGTGGFLLINTGSSITVNNDCALNTIAYSISNKPTYAIEGSIFNCGSALNYIKNTLNMFDNYRELDKICNKAHTNGLCVLPTFTGIGTPYWDGNVRASITNLNLDSTKPDITKATIESFAFMLEEILANLRTKGIKVRELHVDGGVSKTDYLLRLIASTSNLTVFRSKESESTAIGAINLALIACGIEENLKTLSEKTEISKVFTPDRELAQYAKNSYNIWHNELLNTLNANK